ncbi:DciA family protein [Komagataeibacter xylinus]|uniref:DciA family protein n=1 Tax=Komagataeibacter xylinus TaxID=28448 RepID=UPI0035B6952F
MTNPPPRSKKKNEAAAAPEPPRRAFRARSMAALLPQISQPVFRKQSAAAVQVMTDWADIVGPHLAALTVPRKLSAGTLTVGCQGPVAMELQHLAPTVIARINTTCGHGVVKRLKMVQDLLALPQQAPSPAPPRTPPPPVEIDDMPDGPLKEALASLGGWLRARQGQ